MSSSSTDSGRAPRRTGRAETVPDADGNRTVGELGRTAAASWADRADNQSRAHD